MEKLHRHSNGSAVTLSDETAVSLKRITGRRESGVKYFEFFSSPTAEKTTIEWTGDVAVIPTLTAKVLLANGYAENISELQLATWNEMVDGAPAAVEPEQETPVDPPVAPVADTPPVVEETPPPAPVVEETPPVPPIPPVVSDDPPMPPLPKIDDPKTESLKRAEAEAAKAAKAKKASGD